MTKTSQGNDFYEILESDRGATIEELKKNYQRLALSLHPDKSDGDQSEAFLLLQKAWSILRNPLSRKQYDAELLCHEHTELLLYESINLKDMALNSIEGVYTYSCRCGGTYILDITEDNTPKVIIGCDECSFSIEVER